MKDAEEILRRMISEVTTALASARVSQILLSTDLSFDFGTSTLDVREYKKWAPIQERLIRALPIAHVEFNVSWIDRNDFGQFDRAMVGLIEQQLHAEADIFCPAIVRSGFVRTILRKRLTANLESIILLGEDNAIWQRDLATYRRLGILPED